MYFRKDESLEISFFWQVGGIGASSPLPGVPEVRHIDSNLGCWSRPAQIMEYFGCAFHLKMLAVICVHSASEGW